MSEVDKETFMDFIAAANPRLRKIRLGRGHAAEWVTAAGETKAKFEGGKYYVESNSN